MAIGVLVSKVLLALAVDTVIAGSADLESQPGPVKPSPVDGAGSGTGYLEAPQGCSPEGREPCSVSSHPECPTPWRDKPDTDAVFRSSDTASTDHADRMICEEGSHSVAEQASAPPNSDAITAEAGPSGAANSCKGLCLSVRGRGGS